jgi:hypothetical protein
VNANLQAAIRNEILSRIPLNKLSPEDQQGLLALDLRQLLSRFLNWQNRRVSVRPRAVHISNELKAKNRPEVTALAEKIEKGHDLTQLLSKRIETVFIANANRPGFTAARKDIDMLLNEWGIHHLHSIPRSGDLLFVCFRHDDAYMLDLLDHNAWTKESLVEIAVTNWPHAGLFTVMPRMKLEFPVPESARPQLRAAAINTPIQLPIGLVSGPGMSGAGTSSMIEAKINKFWASIVQDQDRCSVSDILDAVRPGLNFHPFSDR